LDNFPIPVAVALPGHWPLNRIASIPIPQVFGKGDFETGIAAGLLAEYAKDPLPYFDPESKKKMTAADRMMWLKFEEPAFDAPAGSRGHGRRIKR
jgi:hypothetical protein